MLAWQSALQLSARVREEAVHTCEHSALCCWQAFCDERGEPLTSHEAGERLSRELDLDREMRMYHRRSEKPMSVIFTRHSRSAASKIPKVPVQLGQALGWSLHPSPCEIFST